MKRLLKNEFSQDNQPSSLGPVYATLFLFLGLEYMVEASSPQAPGGLVFPIGFILFGAFYYSFLKESHHLGISWKKIFTFFIPRKPQRVIRKQQPVLEIHHAPAIPTLPKEVLDALHVLGLQEKVSWDEIHREYRRLAKLYHPDLHASETLKGQRFMAIDAAYHKLERNHKYFT